MMDGEPLYMTERTTYPARWGGGYQNAGGGTCLLFNLHSLRSPEAVSPISICRASKHQPESDPNASSSSVSSQVFIIRIGATIHFPLEDGSQQLVPFSGA